MFSINVVHNLVLGILVMAGNIEVWHLVVLSLVNGSARAAQMPAAGALVPNLVPRPLLLNAIALNQAAMHGSRLLGPAAIAPMLDRLGVEAAFFLCTGFYLVSLVQTLRIGTASTGQIDRARGFVSNMLDGARYIYRTPALLAIVLMALFHCGLTMSFESLLPVLSRQQLNAEGGGFSYLMMSVGAGALVSVFALAGVRKEVTQGRLLLNLGVLSGLAPVALGMSNSMPMALLAAVGMGATQAGFMTITHTMIQSITPDGGPRPCRRRLLDAHRRHDGLRQPRQRRARRCGQRALPADRRGSSLHRGHVRKLAAPDAPADIRRAPARRGDGGLAEDYRLRPSTGACGRRDRCANVALVAPDRVVGL